MSKKPMAFEEIKAIYGVYPKQALFNTQMTKAIMDDKKTMTRRVAKIKNKLTRDWATSTGVEWFKKLDDSKYDYAIRERNGSWAEYTEEEFIKKYSPYKEGDVIYVRETFTTGGICKITPETLWYIRNDLGEKVFYKADIDNAFYDPDFICKWKPSIHMPKEYARIFLHVTNVRIERLHEVTQEDIYEEGVPQETYMTDHADDYSYHCDLEDYAYQEFRDLWNSTATKGYKWEDNPPVFVCEFEKIDMEEAI